MWLPSVLWHHCSAPETRDNNSQIYCSILSIYSFSIAPIWKLRENEIKMVIWTPREDELSILNISRKSNSWSKRWPRGNGAWQKHLAEIGLWSRKYNKSSYIFILQKSNDLRKLYWINVSNLIRNWRKKIWLKYQALKSITDISVLKCA